MTNAAQIKTESPSWTGDLWGGLAAMLVAVPSSVAFGILVFTSVGPEYSGQGALAGLLGAAALGLVAPYIGRTIGLISAPCAPSAAVLSAFATTLLASGASVSASNIFSLIALSSLLSACFQILYGSLGGGRLIKFIPYQVVTGYLSGVSLIIAMGQLPKLLGVPKKTPLLTAFSSPELWQWPSIFVGVATIAIMFIAPRITQKIPAAIFALIGGISVYFGIGLINPSLLVLQNNPHIIGPIQASGSLLESITRQIHALTELTPQTIKEIIVPSLTLSILLSIDTLKTCVGLDAITRSRHHSDREIIGQGIGNLASFLVGGIPGAGTMGPTLVNVTSGAHSPRAGIFEGIFVLLAILFLGKWIAWVPISALAGILLVIAWRMFDKGMFKLLIHPTSRLDFAVIAGVIVVALSVDLIAASGVGIALAILLFIRDQVRGSVVLRKANLTQINSKTRRAENESKILQKFGHTAIVCKLQGNLFFGTTDQLYTQLEPDLKFARFVLLDMRRVQSIDYTAVHLFEQMQSRLKEKNGQVLFSGMPSGLYERKNFEKYLYQLGLAHSGETIAVYDTFDAALEWMEEELLKQNGQNKIERDKTLGLKDFSFFAKFDERALNLLTPCLKERALQTGEKIFSQGDAGDELYLVRRGSVNILLPLPGGKHHHLATISRGSYFGELSFLDRASRSADVVAKEFTEIYAFSRSKFDSHRLAETPVGVQIFTDIALAISERLRSADNELQLLEER